MTENSLEAGEASQGDPSQETPTTAEEWPADAPAVLRTRGIRASSFVDLLASFSAMFRTVAGNANSVERFLAKLGRRFGKSVANGAAAFDEGRRVLRELSRADHVSTRSHARRELTVRDQRERVAPGVFVSHTVREPADLPLRLALNFLSRQFLARLTARQ